MEFLILNGIDMDIKDDDGKTASDIAEKTTQSQVVEVINFHSHHRGSKS